jgi:hypothetical protein
VSGLRIDCPSCGTRDVPPGHVQRCKRIHSNRLAAAQLGDDYGVPTVTTDDLWAHLGHVAAEPEDATRIVRLVLDLGWRPVVGSDPKRLWTASESGVA